jgi:hypothetical protein
VPGSAGPVKAREFYVSDHRRESAEVEFGPRWVDADGRGPYEVIWLVDTGELIAFYRGDSPTMVGAQLGEIGIDFADVVLGLLGAAIGSRFSGPEELVLFGTIADRSELDRRLEGWEEMEGSRAGLAWLQERVGDATA